MSEKRSIIRKIFHGARTFIEWIVYLFVFTFLLNLYLIHVFLRKIYKNIKFSKRFREFFKNIDNKLKPLIYKLGESGTQYGAVNRITLIKIAIKNMRSKKSRTWITMFGVAVGISAIVFLVSIGYGLQNLVVERAIRLEEMKQTDITTQPGSNLRINDKIITDFDSYNNVEDVQPVINVVGRVNYSGSETDVSVYGVTSDYIEHTAIKLTEGEIYESRSIESVDFEKNEQEGSEYGLTEENNLNQETRSESGDDSQVRTYTKDGVEFIDLGNDGPGKGELDVEYVELQTSAVREAVVNQQFLNLLSLDSERAIGRKFEISFVVPGDLTHDVDKKIESRDETYTISGVIPEGSTPYMYVPFTDLKGLGIENYSQLRVYVENMTDLNLVRTKIESEGYVTTSIADTKEEIDAFFGTVRRVLMIVGSFALAVAMLGMFNTLTVSLLERTREIGLMKALGMISDDVRILFLAESMIMSFYGGILGIFLAFILGKLMSVILSLFSIASGDEFLNLTLIPFYFILFVMLLSVVVGWFTGVYPANRAKKISALNALRYE